MPPPPAYLKPYLDATRVHGGSFDALLWASRETQRMRFQAMARLLDFGGMSVLDVGCGRADLLDYLVEIDAVPGEYMGIEMVPALAQAAESGCAAVAAAHRIPAGVLRKDFIADPRALFTGSDVVAISGSINTAPDDAFWATLKRGYDATAKYLIFNFLSSPYLAGADHLYWRDPAHVERFCVNTMSAKPQRLGDYLEGDVTFLLTKPD